jgi:spermidine/putrescine-binding protein
MARASKQNYVRRNTGGVIDPKGLVWGVPYRWGSLVFAFRKDKLEKNGIAPIKVRYYNSLDPDVL